MDTTTDGTSQPAANTPARRPRQSPPTIINCTPHPIVVFLQGGKVDTIEASGICPRVTMHTRDLGHIRVGRRLVPIVSQEPGGVAGMPEVTEGTYYIVSRLVFDSCPERNDLLVPDDLVRDALGGAVLGCRRFSGRKAPRR